MNYDEWSKKYGHMTVVLWDDGGTTERFNCWAIKHNVRDKFFLPFEIITSIYRITIVFTDEQAYMLFCLCFEKQQDNGVTSFPFYQFRNENA